MTNDEIREVARKAGLYQIGAPMHVWQGDISHLTKFAELILASVDVNKSGNVDAKASSRKQVNAVPDGYVVVPVEPGLKIVSSA